MKHGIITRSKPDALYDCNKLHDCNKAGQGASNKPATEPGQAIIL